MASPGRLLQASPPFLCSQVTSEAYVRDPLVKAWVLQNAKGKCEGCGGPLPFTSLDGEPFLECHHVRPLVAAVQIQSPTRQPSAPTAIAGAILGLTAKNSPKAFTQRFPGSCPNKRPVGWAV
jgi:hypothetical protein